MNKKGAELAIGTTINIIIIVLVLVVAIFGIYYLNASGTLQELFPDFKREDLKVSYNEEFKLENPEEIIFYLDLVKTTTLSEDFYYRYDITKTGALKEGPDVGWRWSKNEKEWFAVGNIYRVEYTKLDSSEKEFLKKLEGKSAEEGLKTIVQRVLDNKEGNWARDVHLVIKIGNVEESYDKDSKILLDLDGLIDKLNQITRGVLRQREAEDVKK